MSELPQGLLKIDNPLLYAIEIANKNGIGCKNIDNGIFILVVVNARKIAIANCYLLSDILPDSTTDRIIRKVISPKFKANDFGAGLIAGIEELKREIVIRRKFMCSEKYE